MKRREDRDTNSLIMAEHLVVPIEGRGTSSLLRRILLCPEGYIIDTYDISTVGGNISWRKPHVEYLSHWRLPNWHFID